VSFTLVNWMYHTLTNSFGGTVDPQTGGSRPWTSLYQYRRGTVSLWNFIRDVRLTGTVTGGGSTFTVTSWNIGGGSNLALADLAANLFNGDLVQFGIDDRLVESVSSAGVVRLVTPTAASGTVSVRTFPLTYSENVAVATAAIAANVASGRTRLALDHEFQYTPHLNSLGDSRYANRLAVLLGRIVNSIRTRPSVVDIANYHAISNSDAACRLLTANPRSTSGLAARDARRAIVAQYASAGCFDIGNRNLPDVYNTAADRNLTPLSITSAALWRVRLAETMQVMQAYTTIPFHIALRPDWPGQVQGRAGVDADVTEGPKPAGMVREELEQCRLLGARGAEHWGPGMARPWDGTDATPPEYAETNHQKTTGFVHAGGFQWPVETLAFKTAYGL
jgi:hypothetical protein